MVSPGTLLYIHPVPHFLNCCLTIISSNFNIIRLGSVTIILCAKMSSKHIGGSELQIWWAKKWHGQLAFGWRVVELHRHSNIQVCGAHNSLSHNDVRLQNVSPLSWSEMLLRLLSHLYPWTVITSWLTNSLRWKLTFLPQCQQAVVKAVGFSFLVSVDLCNQVLLLSSRVYHYCYGLLNNQKQVFPTSWK